MGKLDKKSVRIIPSEVIKNRQYHNSLTREKNRSTRNSLLLSRSTNVLKKDTGVSIYNYVYIYLYICINARVQNRA